jgi:hypothetical protein
MSARRSLLLATLLPMLLLPGALAGCSSSDDAAVDAAVCARVDPSCPSAVPSYAATVAPIIQGACTPCHHPDSTYARSSLTSHADVELVYGSALGQVSACLMPPAGPAAGQKPLTDDERDALLAWLACGAPNN